MPVPPVVDRDFTRFCQQNYDVRCSGTDFVIATRTAIRLDGAGCGDRPHFVLMTVGPGFDPAVHRQRP
ncbi:MAG: hypothetical protein J2P17_26380 [Mycobacterium sp.]|nr:hypothetical protein [Mycobacterium sp.]